MSVVAHAVAKSFMQIGFELCPVVSNLVQVRFLCIAPVHSIV